MLKQAASLLHEERPMQLLPGPFLLDAWPGKNFSGTQIIAVLAFGIYVHVGEDPEKCPGLMDSWPIAEAVLLAG